MDTTSNNEVSTPEKGLTLESLMEAVEKLKENHPRATKFNMHELTWKIVKTIAAPFPIRFSAEGMTMVAFGTPVHVVEYLMPSFIEVEYSDGSREILDMRVE